VSPTTGTIAGAIQFDAAAGSPYTVTVTVEDDGLPAASASVTFTWIVEDVPRPPVATGDRYTTNPDGMVVIDAPGVLANDSDPDGGGLTATLVDGPNFGSLQLDPDGSFTYRHDGSPVASDRFTYEVTDATGATARATVTIFIVRPNAAPLPVDDLVSVEAGSTVSLFPTDNDTDPDGDALAITEVTEPDHGSISLSAAGEVTFAAPDDFRGEVVVTYTVVDELGATSSATITFTVTGENHPPSGGNDVVNLANYAVYGIAVLDNDEDPDGDPLRILSIDGDVVGRLELEPNGTVVYQPQPGWIGTDLFTYIVSDPDGLTDIVTVAVTVTPAVRDAATLASAVLGTNQATFENPVTANPFGGSVSLTQGVTLLADAFFQSLGALSLPLAFLGIAFIVALGLGGSTQIPILLAAARRRYWSVVLLDRETILPVRKEPSPDAEPVYNYEPTARGIRSIDKPRTVDGVRWILVDTPNGSGWVQLDYLTTVVDIDDFIRDERPVELVRELTTILDTRGDITEITGERGLAVALDNRPRLITGDRLIKMTTGGDQRAWFDENVAQPLGAALLDLAHISPQTKHSRSALIPVELWNFPYLAIQAPGHRSWLLYFEYVKHRPRLVGIGIDE
jgi:hypothetical protein